MAFRWHRFASRIRRGDAKSTPSVLIVVSRFAGILAISFAPSPPWRMALVSA